MDDSLIIAQTSEISDRQSKRKVNRLEEGGLTFAKSALGQEPAASLGRGPCFCFQAPEALRGPGVFFQGEASGQLTRVSDGPVFGTDGQDRGD